MEFDIANPDLSKTGKERIEWAEKDMPVLRAVREKFEKEKPLEGLKMSACLHVTAETANLARTLKAGGADILLCASNPLSTQDEVAAALVSEYGIPVFAKRGEDKDSFFAHIRKALEWKPRITMDDGADLISVLHKEFPEQAADVIGSMEETTTGVIRLRSMEKDGALRIPVVAVNDARTKNLFDNRYGTGQSTLDGIVRATDKLIAGTVFVVAGYGWCGKGLAMRARGMGAQVIVTEVDHLKALEAVMDGFQVMPMAAAASLGDIFCTVTGNTSVITEGHFRQMKDGAIVCNSGHFDVEIDIPALEKLSGGRKREARPNVLEYDLGGRKIYLLGEGRLVNLAAAKGHPASVMDMSFATQALASEWVAKQKGLEPRVYNVPEEVENFVAQLKLRSMGVAIDALSDAQAAYLMNWQEGT